MDHTKKKNSIRSVTLTAMLLAVLVAQEELLVIVPQFQFTFILILVFSQFLPFGNVILLVVGYVLIDNLYMGTFNLMYSLPPMISIPIFALVSRSLKSKPDYFSFIWIIVFSFIYSWAYIPMNMLMIPGFDWWAYFVIDIPWEIALAASNMITFLLLYKPLTEIFNMNYKRIFKPFIQTKGRY